MTAKQEIAEIKTYEIVTVEDTFRIEIPASYKVTYGMLHPGTRGSWNYNNNGGGFTLRIYESEAKQRACFQNVLSFRDVSLPLSRKTRKVNRSRNAADSDGGNESLSNLSIEENWETIS